MSPAMALGDTQRRQLLRKWFARLSKRLDRQRSANLPPAVSSAEGYERWAANYDDQPDNPALVLEERVFGALLGNLEIRNLRILDFGCGTGRHWPRLRDGAPGALEGVDLAQAMLDRLTQKFPGERVYCLSDPLAHRPSAPYDLIVCTLVLGHIRDPLPVIRAWADWIAPGGAVLLTMLHPAWEAWGLSRSFDADGKTIRIEHYFHRLEALKFMFEENGLVVVDEVEAAIDESVKLHYERLGQLSLYGRTKGRPTVWGCLLKAHDTSGN